jgi:hypothetical protein
VHINVTRSLLWFERFCVCYSLRSCCHVSMSMACAILFHLEFSYQPRLKIYCGVSLFSDFRYNGYLRREAATVVKLKSRIRGYWVTQMGTNLSSSTPICALLGICDLCMLPHYFPSVTALFLHLGAKNVHLSPSLLAFYASPHPLDVLLCFSLFREVFAFDIIWSMYSLDLQCT